MKSLQTYHKSPTDKFTQPNLLLTLVPLLNFSSKIIKWLSTYIQFYILHSSESCQKQYFVINYTNLLFIYFKNFIPFLRQIGLSS